MEKPMLQAQIQQPYRRESWIALLQHIFEGVDIFQQPKGWPLTTQSEKKLARSLVQFGRITLTDGKLIGFFEVDVGKDVDLASNRVGLRKLVARCIDEISAHAVLAFFVKAGRDEYRLSYAARESTLEQRQGRLLHTEARCSVHVPAESHPLSARPVS
jgi:hypothetical protein